MQNERLKQIKRALAFYRICSASVLDVAIATAIVYFFKSEYEQFSWLAVAGVAICIWIAEILFSLRKFVAILLGNQLWTPRLIEGLYLETLRDSNLPPPAPVHPVNASYLGYIGDDITVKGDLRVRAVALATAFQIAQSEAGIAGGVMLARAADDASKRYNDELSEMAEKLWKDAEAKPYNS